MVEVATPDNSDGSVFDHDLTTFDTFGTGDQVSVWYHKKCGTLWSFETLNEALHGVRTHTCVDLEALP